MLMLSLTGAMGQHAIQKFKEGTQTAKIPCKPLNPRLRLHRQLFHQRPHQICRWHKAMSSCRSIILYRNNNRLSRRTRRLKRYIKRDVIEREFMGPTSASRWIGLWIACSSYFLDFTLEKFDPFGHSPMTPTHISPLLPTSSAQFEGATTTTGIFHIVPVVEETQGSYHAFTNQSCV
jgi:hypothetical protein